MALRATIYKVVLNVADSDRHYYNSHNLTIARHPSETDIRMMVRIIAFALHANESLSFTKGLSETDEPDIWDKDLTDAIDLWIEVGQPEERRLQKACGRANRVSVYCYQGQSSKIWWNGVRDKLAKAGNLSVKSIPQQVAQALGALAQRNMTVNVNVSEGVAFVNTESGDVVVETEVFRD